MAKVVAGGDGAVDDAEISVVPVPYSDVESFRTAGRLEATCQIVRDSILPQGLATPFLILIHDRPAGYGGVWKGHFPRRAMEFFVAQQWRHAAPALFRAFLRSSGATHVEAQTNIALMFGLAAEYSMDLSVENVLFEDGPTTDLSCPGADFRRRRQHEDALDGEWVVERGGAIVAAGGILRHYNPPFVDLYMSVKESARRQGLGSYVIQQLRRTCRDSRETPAARCDPGNRASRGALARGGLLECGHLVAGPVDRALLQAG